MKIYRIKLKTGHQLFVNQNNGEWKIKHRDHVTIPRFSNHPRRNAIQGKTNISYFNLQLTSKCNLKCDYCYTATDSHNSKRSLTSDEIFEIINFGFNSGISKIHLAFHGGEPLLAIEMIKKILNHPNANRIVFSIQTNGTLLDDSIIKFLITNKIQIAISFDGPEDIHNLHRAGFNKTYNAIQLLKLNGYKDFGIGATLTLKTATSINKVIDFFVDNDLNEFSISYVLNSGAANENLILSSNQTFTLLKKIFQRIMYFYRKGRVIKERDISTYIVYLFSDLRNYMCNASPCGAGNTMISVSADGGIYPCDHFNSLADLKLGTTKNLNNIKINLKRVLNTQIFSKLMPICTECPFINICYGICPAERFYNRNIFINLKSWHSCFRAKFYRFLIEQYICKESANKYINKVLNESIR